MEPTEQRADARRRRRLERAQKRAREAGVSRPLYGLVRAALRPVFWFWFRLRIEGSEHIPAERAAIVAPNHKSFMDAFFIAMGTRRHVRYMVKTEAFVAPLGSLLTRLGAFPVRRGEGDADALHTARTILQDGGILVVFPEGTRVEDADALGSPHHGAGRLALECATPIVPAAITGTAHLWFGPIAKPRRVRVAFGSPIAPPREATADAVAELVDRRVWPEVQREYGRLRAAPGLILTALTALGIGAGLLARRQERARPKLLGVVQPRKLRRHLPWRR